MIGFKPLTLDELFDLELPELEYVVDELLPLGHAGLVSAREKAGKGLLAIDLCASVAAGEPFLDRATMEGPAIYAAAEEHIRDVRDRIAARIGDRRDAPLYVLPLDGSTDDRLDLGDVDGMQKLYNMVNDVRPVILVLDVLRELHERTEDSADEMGPLLRPVRQLAHETNTAVLVTHHQRKAGGFRGSTAIKAAFDLEWSLTGDGDDDGPPAGLLRVEGRHGPRVTLRVRFGEGARWELSTAPIADLITPDRIMLHLETVNAWQTAKEIADATGRPLKTLQNELSRLRAMDPRPLAISGGGHKGNPSRYRSLSPRFSDAPSDCAFPRNSLGGREGGNNPDDVPIAPRNHVGSNGNNAARSPELPAPPEIDPDVVATVTNPLALTPPELLEYEAELLSAPADDLNLAHDRAAFAIARSMRQEGAPCSS